MTESSAFRDKLVARARELQCFPDPEQRTDAELADAIGAEEAGARWLKRYESLPTEAAKRSAVQRLNAALEASRTGTLENPMSDPAIKATQRAWVEEGGGPAYYRTMTDAMNATAREALKPIRDWSAIWSIELVRRDLGQAWSELAPLIFTSEELA